MDLRSAMKREREDASDTGSLPRKKVIVTPELDDETPVKQEGSGQAAVHRVLKLIREHTLGKLFMTDALLELVLETDTSTTREDVMVVVEQLVRLEWIEYADKDTINVVGPSRIIWKRLLADFDKYGPLISFEHFRNDTTLERADLCDADVLSSLHELAASNFIMLTEEGNKLDQIVQVMD
jgi:hypothetical protein